MSQTTGFYPIIIIPDLILQFCRNNPIPALEEADTNTKLPSPPLPPAFDNSRYFLVIQIWIASLLLVMLINWLSGMSITAFWLSLGCASAIAVAAFFYLRFVDSQVSDRYKQKLTEYQQQSLNYETHQSDCFQSTIKGDEQYYLLSNERSNCLKILLKRKVQVPIYQNTLKVQQGVSEKQFFIYLCRYFSESYNFCMGGEFPIPGKNFSYSADFVFIHKPTGLAVDIEIDEPYDGRTGKPHHCVDISKDKQRNQFFLERNWVVIRFSELQVVKYPISCCKVIARTIAQITGDYTSLVHLRNVANLIPHKQWTIKQASYMSKTKFRNSYLTNFKLKERLCKMRS